MSRIAKCLVLFLRDSYVICALMMAGDLAAQTGPPVILSPPQNTNVFAGATATFTVVASGMQPLTYQWFRAGTLNMIPNATNATLILPGVDEPDSGAYVVKVSNTVDTRTAGASLMVTRADFGDAPAPYPTLLSDDGARHALVQGIYLGAGVSFEPDGQPDLNASHDPFDDGVTFCSALVRGNPCSVRVVASVNGYLDGWIDFSGNGNWDEPGEQIFPSVPLMAGTNFLSFAVPAAVPAAVSDTFARFRFSTTGGLRPTGFATNGEVEDYKVSIYSVAADLCANAMLSLDTTPPSNGQCVLAVTNFGPSLASNVILSNTLSGSDIFGVQGPSTSFCGVQGDTVYCSLGDLQPGEFRFIQFSFHPKLPSLITNIVSVRSDVFDPKPANNRGTVVIRAAPPLFITTPPQSVRVLPGKSASFSVSAQGFGPLTYQWLLNGAPIADATNSTLTLPHVTSSAEIRVQVSDSLGAVLSPPAFMGLALSPRIVQCPQSITVSPGTGAQFFVQADDGGSPYLQFQWRLNGANIPGATNPVYEIAVANRFLAGSYTVAVASDGGVAVCDPALLTCSDIAPFPAADSFALRPSLTQAGPNPYQGVVQTSNCNATNEPGEPNHAGQVGGASVWYQWTAPANGIATFDTIGSTFDTLLAVYTGTSFSNLTEMASDDDHGGYFRSLVQFCVQAGTNYAIAIDGFAGKCGVVVLGWSVEQTSDCLPKITVQPRGLSALTGTAAGLSVTAIGGPGSTLSYQWFLNGRFLPGATNPTLDIPVKRDAVGTYTVKVFGSPGRFVESRPAVVEIGPVPGIQSQDKVEGVLYNGNTNGNTSVGGAGGKFAAASIGGGPAFVSVGFGIPGTQIMNSTNSTSDIDCFRIGSATRWLGIVVTNDPAAAGSVLRVDTSGSGVMTELGVYQYLIPSCLQSVICMHTNIVGCDTNTGAGGSYSLVQFTPQLGGLYIAYGDGLSGAQGTIQLNWQLGRPPILDPPDAGCAVVFAAGSTATLSAGVTNNPSPTPTYQWSYYGVPLANATNSTLVFTPIQSSNAGAYTVVVSNAFGVVTNYCCVIVNPPQLRYQTVLTNLNISAALLPGCVLQAATNLSPPITWAGIATNTFTNCNFLFAAPMMDTNGRPLPPRFYRTWAP